jgi:hypothetical protein
VVPQIRYDVVLIDNSRLERRPVAGSRSSECGCWPKRASDTYAVTAAFQHSVAALAGLRRQLRHAAANSSPTTAWTHVCLAAQAEHFTITDATSAWEPKPSLSQPLPLVVDDRSLGGGLPRRSHRMVSFDIPTAVNGIWRVTRDYLATDVSRTFAALTVEIGRQHTGVLSDEARVLNAGMRALQNMSPQASGNLDIERLCPAADIEPSMQNPFGGATPTETMYRYAVAVIEAAMRCYVELASWVTPRFDGTLGHRGLMPIEFFGDMYYKPENSPFRLAEPGYAWLLRPLGTSTNFHDAGGNRVSLTVNDEERDQEIRDDRATLYKSFRLVTD